MQISNRRNKILELINNKQIETQDEIVAALIAEGYRVTQATISRDIKEMGLVKVAAASGKQFYAKESGGRKLAGKVADTAYSSIITAALNDKLVVIKTIAGFGKVTKYAIEGMAEFIGCLADDDTVFVAFADNDSASGFYKKLNSLILY